MTTLVYPYHSGSKSAKAISEALNIKRAARERDEVIPADVIINWGCARIRRPVKAGAIILNSPKGVAIAHHKLKTFECLSQADVNIPMFTTNPRIAQELADNGSTVVVRHTCTGHSGEGIELVEPGQKLTDEQKEAPLFTLYIPKKEEYRIHVSSLDGVFFVQRKARKKDVPDEKVNWKIRNHSNGFIFAHNGVDVPDEAKRMAINALKAVNLDFGALDVMLGRDGKWYVLEINTACGVEGTTTTKYVEILKRLIENV